MIVQAKKYGNSRVINIPPALWEFFRFNDQSNFSFENESGQLVIRALPSVEKSMDRIDAQYGELFQRLADN
mgnify:CR=1 FL=1